MTTYNLRNLTVESSIEHYPFVSLTKVDIPTYLHKSRLYLDLEDDNDTFDVPFLNLKKDISIESFFDLEHLLHTIRYWMLDIIPSSIYDGIIQYRNNFNILVDKFYDLPNFKEFEFLVLNINDDEILTKCVRYNYIQLMKYLHSHNFKLDVNTTNEAIKYGNIDCLKYLLEKDCIFDVSSSNIAIKNGQFECLKFLNQNGFKLSCSSVQYATENGNLDILKYCLENNCTLIKNNDHYATAKVALRFGNLDILKYVHQNGCDLYESARCITDYLNIANKTDEELHIFQCNLLAIVKYLHQNGIEIDAILSMYEIITYGNIDLFKYCYENTIDKNITNRIMRLIIKYNNLDMLIYAIDNDGQLYENMTNEISRYNDLDMLKYAQDNNWP